MKYKKLIVIAILLIMIIATIGNLLITKSQINNENIKITQISFTIGDKGTEIEVELKNPNKTEADINKIIATIYDENNKRIGAINKNTNIKLKANKSQKISLTSKEKYVNSSKIKYKIN